VSKHLPLTRILLVALAIAALATGGIALNVLLLGQADSRNDPVGKLTPRARISEPTPPASTPTTTHEQTETEVEEPDD
jgi:hypothetical protein